MGRAISRISRRSRRISSFLAQVELIPLVVDQLTRVPRSTATEGFEQGRAPASEGSEGAELRRGRCPALGGWVARRLIPNFLQTKQENQE